MTAPSSATSQSVRPEEGLARGRWEMPAPFFWVVGLLAVAAAFAAAAPLLRGLLAGARRTAPARTRGSSRP